MTENVEDSNDAQKNQLEAEKSNHASRTILAQNKMHMKTTLKELLFYVMYLIDLCILTFGMVSSDMYFLSNAMSSLFVDSTNFASIHTMEHFWTFVEGPLLDGIYWDTWYNNVSLPEGDSYIFYENMLLGVPQIRQLKVRNDTCIVHGYFQNTIMDCYGPYSYVNEELSPFGPGNDTLWEYYEPQHLNDWHWGVLGFYSNGGYRVNLARTKDGSAELIADLKLNGWLDKGTRVVFIDFSVYNANVNLFCVVRLVVEFPAAGGALPSWQFYSVKLLRYVSSSDYFIASCEIIFCIFNCAFLIVESIEIYKTKTAYFKDAWNCLDLLMVGIAFVAAAFNLFRTSEVAMLLEGLLDDLNTYPDFHFLGYWQTQYNNMIAVNIFLAWIKIFKYISFNKTMMQLSTTLSRCAKDIIGFAIMFFIVFFSYAQFAYLIFGTQVQDFYTFQNCIFTQFRIILGDFNFEDLENANRILGPIYFITYIFFVFFVLLNMFLAIINDTYSEVKSDASVCTGDFNILDMIKKSYNRALVKLNLKEYTIEDVNRGIRETAGGQIDLDYLKTFLKRKGYSEEDIQACFTVYNVNRDRKPSDIQGLISDLENMEKNRQSVNSAVLESYHGERCESEESTPKDYQQLFRYTHQLEMQINEIKLKIDDIASELRSLNENKRRVHNKDGAEDEITEIGGLTPEIHELCEQYSSRKSKD